MIRAIWSNFCKAREGHLRKSNCFAVYFKLSCILGRRRNYMPILHWLDDEEARKTSASCLV
jgi:hypothetical protein